MEKFYSKMDAAKFEDFAELSSGEYEEDAKYEEFRKWAENNGVIAPKVKFPARFGKMGLVGISCTETIEPCEAFIYVPTKMIIRSDKVKSSAIGFILSNTPSIQY